MRQQTKTVTVPKAGDLILAILDEISIRPTHLSELRTEVAIRMGFPTKLVDRSFPPDSNNSFQSKLDAAVAFLIRENLVSRLGRGKPISMEKRGWAVYEGQTPLDIDRVTSQIEPKYRVRGQNLPSSGQTPRRGAVADEGKSEMRKEARAIAERLSRTLPDMRLDGMYHLCLNAKRHLEDERPLMQAAAALILQAIDVERARRKHQAPGSESREGAFRWPSTEVHQGKSAAAGRFEIENPAPEGMLVRMGYRVGMKRGESDYSRQRILQRIFEQDLAGEESFYKDSWGANGSAHRLKKLAYTIAALTRNAKRRSVHRMDEAINQWEDDLAFLHQRYYVGQFDFPWPVVETPEPEQEEPSLPAFA